MKRLNLACGAVVLGAAASFSALAAGDAGKEELRKSLKDLDLAGSWVYDDLEAGLAAARSSGKPLLAVFR